MSFCFMRSDQAICHRLGQQSEKGVHRSTDCLNGSGSFVRHGCLIGWCEFKGTPHGSPCGACLHRL
jgi:hypothetical protein